MRENITANKLPVVDGVIPVVVTFDDSNTFTARHMSEYLAIVTEESGRVGLMVAEKPFYGSAAEIEKAALARSADAPAAVARQPGASLSDVLEDVAK